MLKPKRWPKMGYGEGGWDYDTKTQECILRCTVNGERVRIRSFESTTDAMMQRDKLRMAVAEQAELAARVESRPGQRESAHGRLGQASVGVDQGADDQR